MPKQPLESCKHFWRVQGAPSHRWFDGHALALCVHCFARTIVEYGAGIGPCEHAVGRHLAGTYETGFPLAKESGPPPDEWAPDPAYMDCPTCEELRLQTPAGKEIKLCSQHKKQNAEARI